MSGVPSCGGTSCQYRLHVDSIYIYQDDFNVLY